MYKHEVSLNCPYEPKVCAVAVFQTKVEDLSALDVLAGDFVAPAKASGVQAPVQPPTKKTPQVKCRIADL